MKQIQRQLILDKYGSKCAYCGCDITIKDMQVDHIIPKRQFIYDINNKIKVPKFLNHLTITDIEHADNLNPTCRVCNKWKDAMPLELFRSEIAEQTNRLHKYSASYRIARKYRLLELTTKPVVFYFEKLKNDETN